MTPHPQPLASWSVIYRFSPENSNTCEFVGIVPRIDSPDSGNHGLPLWYFDDFYMLFVPGDDVYRGTGKWVKTPCIHQHYELTLWPGGWRIEWVPEMGFGPIWQTVKSPAWNPLAAGAWDPIFDSHNNWCQRVFT